MIFDEIGDHFRPFSAQNGALCAMFTHFNGFLRVHKMAKMCKMQGNLSIFFAGLSENEMLNS